MLQEMVEVLNEGESNGNNMIIQIKPPSGLEIVGLPTENFYGGEWDLGPTWNYAVLADRPFLVDTGKSGMGRRLLKIMESAGVSENDLEFILLSHGHEDHDGGLKDFPASCWRCFMPESFSNQHCLGYHQKRNSLKIEEIGDGRCSLAEGIHTYYVPGHSPDALAILIGEEVLIVGTLSPN